MKIDISDHRKIFAVQEEFSTLFPNLKIEFFGKPNKTGGAPSAELVKHPGKTVGECRTVHNKGPFQIDPSMTIADIKQSLADTFGLSVNISRKSGDKWVSLEKEGVFSLAEQNRLPEP